MLEKLVLEAGLLLYLENALAESLGDTPLVGFHLRVTQTQR